MRSCSQTSSTSSTRSGHEDKHKAVVVTAGSGVLDPSEAKTIPRRRVSPRIKRRADRPWYALPAYDRHIIHLDEDGDNGSRGAVSAANGSATHPYPRSVDTWIEPGNLVPMSRRQHYAGADDVGLEEQGGPVIERSTWLSATATSLRCTGPATIHHGSDNTG